MKTKFLEITGANQKSSGGRMGGGAQPDTAHHAHNHGKKPPDAGAKIISVENPESGSDEQKWVLKKHLRMLH